MAFLLHLHNPFPSFSSSNASPVLDLNFTNRQLVSDLHECYSDLKSVFHQLASAPDDALAREMIFEEIGEANVKMVCGRAREETWDDVLILWDIMKGAGLDGAIYDHEHRARRADRGIAADVVTKPEMESGVKVHQVADALRSIDTLISTAATERT
ncbi:MAG: hypothetical protein M1827_006158 [Pycnora praestabilis]|nr:MAG: hypothetical protein M1827_006158 [Pycnora praestabilis]